MAEKIGADTSYICVKALEKGVNIIGVTRGEVTKIHHTEKLDKGENVLQNTTGLGLGAAKNCKVLDRRVC